MSDTQTRVSLWKRFRTPLIVLACGLGIGYMEYTPMGGDDYVRVFGLIIFCPLLIMAASLGAAFGRNTRFGSFCAIALVFIIAFLLGQYGAAMR